MFSAGGASVDLLLPPIAPSARSSNETARFHCVGQYRLAAEYVDRILRGEKPAELPVQTPIKFEPVVNLKAAKQLGLSIPSSMLASADEVIG
jgi:ABC-type uncharacterized transport system substrate-binding protein